jgi:enolase
MQEFMIVPPGAASFAEGLQMGSETYQQLKALLKERGFTVAVGDEGGFAPDLESGEESIGLITEAIEKAGYQPETQIAIALDPAASEFFRDGTYALDKSGKSATPSEAMVSLYSRWTDKYPIVSIEDGLAEDDGAAGTFLQENSAVPCSWSAMIFLSQIQN